jgi:D-alanyl-D-alanine carboxypeptidase (penicillin-binding protein 5/6)
MAPAVQWAAVRLRLLALLAALAAGAAPGAHAAAPQQSPQPQARAWLVQNGATGEVLAAHNHRGRVPIASITKLMTVLVALERARLDEVVTITRATTAIGESSIQLRTGERVRVRTLVEAALVQSANDAAHALAVHVAGSASRFVALMNVRARELGLVDTHFVRPDGLDVPGHLSSARDATLLGRIAMRRPVVRAIVGKRTIVSGGRTLRTWNDLLGRFPGLVGVKTGHTTGAGWSQVAAARGRGLTIYATLLGSPSRDRRNADLAALLRWGLAQYRVVPAVDRARVYARASTEYGRPDVRLVAPQRSVRVVRVGQPLVERVVAPAGVALPVRKGQQLGEVRVFAGTKLLASRPLVAAETITKPGLAGRVGWYAGRTLRNAWSIVGP